MARWLTLGAVVAIGCTGMPQIAAGQTAPAAQAGMVLGVSTHFDQGWPVSLLAKLGEVHAASFRDDISWDKGEPSRGVYDFSEARIGFARRACASAIDMLLVIDPRHPGYDGGYTAHSPAAQAAFGTYLAKLLDQLPAGCVAGIEVGNEINAEQGMRLPVGMDRARTYVALLRAVRDAIKPRHPGVTIVGASTNVIGTGFIETVAAAGGLAVMDAVAVHPYRAYPDGIDLELDRLRAAMARHGPVRPIWVTEFGNYFANPDQAPPLLIKMAMMLGAAGVQRSYWYALLDEPWFANMGLYDPQHQAKPAADAFHLAAATLLTGAAPRRIAVGDRRSFVFRLGSGGYVLWGDPRPLRLSGNGTPRDARGRPITPPTMLSDDPVILPPQMHFALGDGPVLADSLPEFGASPWHYLARSGAGAPIPLAMRDWQWTSFFGAAGLDPLAINSTWLAPTGNGAAPVRAVLRYTSPTNITAEISACFTKKNVGDGVDVRIISAGKPVYQGIVTETTRISDIAIKLTANQSVDVEVGPNRDAGNDAVNYRVRLLRKGARLEPACVSS